MAAAQQSQSQTEFTLLRRRPLNLLPAERNGAAAEEIQRTPAADDKTETRDDSRVNEILAAPSVESLVANLRISRPKSRPLYVAPKAVDIDQRERGEIPATEEAAQPTTAAAADVSAEFREDPTIDQLLTTPSIETLFVDFNFFRTDSNYFCVKELAVIGYTSEGDYFQQCFLVKSPYPFDACRQNLTRHYKKQVDRHGILWDDGEVLPRDITIFNKIQDSTIVMFLTKFKEDIAKPCFPILWRKNTYNLHSLEIRQWTHLKPKPLLCPFHALKPGKECALNNVRLMSVRHSYQRFAKKGIFSK